MYVQPSLKESVCRQASSFFFRSEACGGGVLTAIFFPGIIFLISELTTNHNHPHVMPSIRFFKTNSAPNNPLVGGYSLHAADDDGLALTLIYDKLPYWVLLWSALRLTAVTVVSNLCDAVLIFIYCANLPRENTAVRRACRRVTFGFFAHIIPVIYSGCHRTKTHFARSPPVSRKIHTTREGAKGRAVR